MNTKYIGTFLGIIVILICGCSSEDKNPTAAYQSELEKIIQEGTEIPEGVGTLSLTPIPKLDKPEINEEVTSATFPLSPPIKYGDDENLTEAEIKIIEPEQTPKEETANVGFVIFIPDPDNPGKWIEMPMKVTPTQ